MLFSFRASTAQSPVQMEIPRSTECRGSDCRPAHPRPVPPASGPTRSPDRPPAPAGQTARFVRWLNRFSKRPYTARESPIRSAKIVGPARSPITLEMPSPFSANDDAHSLTPCSHAPAQTIRTASSQNVRDENSARGFKPCSPSAISGVIGVFRKISPFAIGRSAHSGARIRQLE